MKVCSYINSFVVVSFLKQVMLGADLWISKLSDKDISFRPSMRFHMVDGQAISGLKALNYSSRSAVCNYIWFISVLQELIVSVGSLEFSGGKAEISDVSKCVGDVSFCNTVFAYLYYNQLVPLL